MIGDLVMTPIGPGLVVGRANLHGVQTMLIESQPVGRERHKLPEGWIWVVYSLPVDQLAHVS
ncbi:MAG: hypothetical protein GYA58_03415 [Anaerolineaceae bacterium]|nr:hypothetical protein [Anaerolineaceae bacterium]